MDEEIKNPQSGTWRNPTMGFEYRYVPLGDYIAPCPLRLPQADDPDRSPISHSRPIPGGFSGSLMLQLKATTPVLFGVKEKSGNVETTVPARLHSGPDAPFVMPGRTSRGMVRAIYRIATFSSLSPLNAHESYANRSPEYRKLHGFTKTSGKNALRGWLMCEENAEFNAKTKRYKWVIRPQIADHGERELDLDNLLSVIDFGNEEIRLGRAKKRQLGLDENTPSFLIMYADHAIQAKLKKMWWGQITRANDNKQHDKLVDNFASITSLEDRDGNKVTDNGGYLVISGPMATKKSEKIFSEPDFADKKCINIPDHVMDQFLVINSSYKKNGPLFPDGVKRTAKGAFARALVEYARSPTSAFPPDLLENLGVDTEAFESRPDNGAPGIPVHYFFADKAAYEEDHGKEDRVKFGLPELFSIPHRYTTADVRTRTNRFHQDNKGDIDWAHALFGSDDANKADDEAYDTPPDIGKKTDPSTFSQALKGRVSFGFARSANATAVCIPGRAFKVTQGQPRGGYDPASLMFKGLKDIQPPFDSRASWDSRNAVLAGHRRYPAVRPYESLGQHFPITRIEGMENWVTPLNSGAVFDLTMDFDNLHPLELGALLWSVSFGDRSVFTNANNTRFRHVSGRLRNKGLGRLKPQNATVEMTQNPMPEEMRISKAGDMASRIDLLMLAFESHMGGWLIATGQSEESDEVDAFYNSLPISTLLNLSDSTWSGTGGDGQRFQLPQGQNREYFDQFKNLRINLYNNSGIYAPPHPVKTVLDDFFHTASAPARPAFKPVPEQAVFNALLDPHRALAAWHEKAQAKTS